MLGVYAGPASAAAISKTNNLVGHQVHFAMDFLDGTSWASITDPAWFISQWKNTGYSMIWGVPMLPNTGASLDTGATARTPPISRPSPLPWSQAAKAPRSSASAGKINGGWFPWAAKNGHTTTVIDYWRQIVTTMRSVAGANFQFEWNPTRGDQGVGNLANYYPGDTYVDIVGLDVYDLEWATYPGRG